MPAPLLLDDFVKRDGLGRDLVPLTERLRLTARPIHHLELLRRPFQTERLLGVVALQLRVFGGLRRVLLWEDGVAKTGRPDEGGGRRRSRKRINAEGLEI